MAATSSALTMRLSEIFFRYSWRICGSGTPNCSARARMTPSMRGPSTIPGRIALTRMSSSPSSAASDFIIPTMAHLVAAYGVRQA
ncbi:hypothetical protein D3C71_2094520 [compost metagenome]